jgi:hypothetical protein
MLTKSISRPNSGFFSGFFAEIFFNTAALAYYAAVSGVAYQLLSPKFGDIVVAYFA